MDCHKDVRKPGPKPPQEKVRGTCLVCRVTPLETVEKGMIQVLPKCRKRTYAEQTWIKTLSRRPDFGRQTIELESFHLEEMEAFTV